MRETETNPLLEAAGPEVPVIASQAVLAGGAIVPSRGAVWQCSLATVPVNPLSLILHPPRDS